MGKWAESLFSEKKIGEIGLIFAGSISEKFKKKILSSFDEVLFSKRKAYDAILAKKENLFVPIVFNVVSYPSAISALTYLQDGGCKTVIFLGYAYGGFENLDVGEFVIPEKAHHFEGVPFLAKMKEMFSLPDEILKEKIKFVMGKNELDFKMGENISVPSVMFQLPHANKEYKKIKPLTLEMEFAAFCFRAKEMGIRGAGILIVSDNKKHSIRKKEKRSVAMLKLSKTIIKNISEFQLDPLEIKNKFNIDEHLANIIHDPEDEQNIYRME